MERLKFIVFILIVLSLPACKDDSEQSDFFIRGTSVHFYYIDENGNSLLDPDDAATWPIPSAELLAVPPAAPADYKDGSYYGGLCRIGSDGNYSFYYFTTGVYGNYRTESFTMYLYFKGEADRMDIVYDYSTPDFGGRDYYANIVSWRVNGVEIYDDDAEERTVDVFIRKADGKTTVSLER